MAGNAVEKREERKTMTIRDARMFLTSEPMMEQFRSVVSAALKPERLVKVALTAMSRNPDLLACTQESLALALMESGSLGLEPTGVLGEAYLVPRWNKNVKAHEANFQAGWRGLVKLARRSGEVLGVRPEVVYEHDHFFYQLGLDQKLEHIPCKPSERGELVYAYAVAHMRSGPPIFVVLPKEEIEKARRVSAAANNGPWVSWYEEMAKKTAVRKLCKLLPMEAEADALLAYDAAVDTQAHGAGRVSLSRFTAARAEDVPEPEQRPRTDPQAVSKGLANQLGAKDKGKATPPDEDDGSPPSHTQVGQLQDLREQCRAADAIDGELEQACEDALATEDGAAVRLCIRELSKALIAVQDGGQGGLGLEG